jgi:CheY-like chemotaxis protein/anti-sigma regulatory factor (Ser/Thr protein kinase)
LSDLAQIARIESGNIKPHVEAFALNDLFEDLRQEFAALAIGQQVEFRLVATKMWVKSDQHLLRRIIQNLVGNAFRYASSGKVLLGARVFDNQVVIQILDNGPGIPLEKQALVFEQFTQLDTPTSQFGRGLGLGLNITQSLVQLMGHSLSLQSREGQGCKFSITVKQASPLAIKPPLVTPIQNMGLRDITVLCIDNDPDVLSGMVELLSAWQCNILAADSRETALQEFVNHQSDIDILLVDYQLGYQAGMPAGEQADGLTLIADMRKECHHYIPAILITATTESDVEDKAANANVGFMRKLVKPAALRAMMSAKLAQKLQVDYGD